MSRVGSLSGDGCVRAARAALAAGFLLGCGSTPAAQSTASSYLEDASYRRAELEASIVNPRNGYSRLRLDHYETGRSDDWSRLPEWNPATEPVLVSDLDDPQRAASPLSPSATALDLPSSIASEDDDRLLVLGKIAFERYPVQLAPYASVALTSRTAAIRYGLWLDDERGAGGLVRAQMGDGTTQLAITCSTCHAAAATTGIENGLPNANVNIGQAILDSGALTEPAPALATWGGGRLDVTTSAGVEPARIPDLRPVSFLTYLQQDATLKARSRTSLAIRIETLVITSSGQVLRPPRVIALALATYLDSLGAKLPASSAAESASSRGASLFASTCSTCHELGSLNGPPVPLGIIGTDATLGLSADRGTGAYRVPSLHGVGTRGPLLHDGTVPSLEALLDPNRLTEPLAGRLHGAGSVAGHAFGLEFSEADRSALLAYLHAL